MAAKGAEEGRPPQEVARRAARGGAVYRRSRRLPFRSGPFPLSVPVPSPSRSRARGAAPPREGSRAERPFPEALLDQVARDVRPATGRRREQRHLRRARPAPDAETPSSRTLRRPCTPRKSRQAVANSASPESVARVQRLRPRRGLEVLVAVLQGDRARARCRAGAAGAPPRRTAPAASCAGARGRRCPRRTCAPGRCSSRLRPRSPPRASSIPSASWTRSWPWVPSRRSSRRRIAGGELADGAHADLEQDLFHLRAHAPEAPHGQRGQERRLRARRHHHEAVRLAHVGGDLGHHLRGGHADGGGELRALADGRLERARDVLAGGRPSRVAKRRRLPVTSRKASSMETGSTASVNRRSTSMTCARDARRISPCPAARRRPGGRRARPGRWAWRCPRRSGAPRRRRWPRRRARGRPAGRRPRSRAGRAARDGRAARPRRRRRPCPRGGSCGGVTGASSVAHGSGERSGRGSVAEGAAGVALHARLVRLHHAAVAAAARAQHLEARDGRGRDGAGGAGRAGAPVAAAPRPPLPGRPRAIRGRGSTRSAGEAPSCESTSRRSCSMRASSMVRRRAPHAPISTASTTPTTAASTAATPRPEGLDGRLAVLDEQHAVADAGVHGVDGEHRRAPWPPRRGRGAGRAGASPLRAWRSSASRPPCPPPGRSASRLARDQWSTMPTMAASVGTSAGRKGTEASRPRT